MRTWCVVWTVCALRQSSLIKNVVTFSNKYTKSGDLSDSLRQVFFCVSSLTRFYFISYSNTPRQSCLTFRFPFTMDFKSPWLNHNDCLTTETFYLLYFEFFFLNIWTVVPQSIDVFTLTLFCLRRIKRTPAILFWLYGFKYFTLFCSKQKQWTGFKSSHCL